MKHTKYAVRWTQENPVAEEDHETAPVAHQEQVFMSLNNTEALFSASMYAMDLHLAHQCSDPDGIEATYSNIRVVRITEEVVG